MNSAPYGHALYYPYIHLQDDRWIKVAALYYDGLSRIVPQGFRTDDSHTVRVLNDEIQFVRDLDPGREAAEITYDFLEFAREELSDPRTRTAVVHTVKRRLPRRSGFRIHAGKLGEGLGRELQHLGLAKAPSKWRRWRPEPWGSWYDFEPVTGALYMMALAQTMAKRRGLPIVTDEPAFQGLIRGIQFDTRDPRTDKAHALASLVIKTAVPDNIESVPIDRIVQFRRRHDSERHRFYAALQGVAQDIPSIDEPEAFEDCLNHHKKSIDDAVKDLRLSLTDVGIGSTIGLFGLSLPSWASDLAAGAGDLGIGITTVGMVSLAAGVLTKEGRNYYRSRKDSPWSYVLSLERGIDSESFLRTLLEGTVLL